MNSPPFLTPKIREQTDRAAPGRTCLLVLGMHRSGTSAIARLLSLAGAKLPASLMGAGKGNATGHWESGSLVQYHDRLLKELGSDWRDWRALEIGRLPLERRRDIKTEIGDLLAAEFGDAPLFVVKDPRICRFAPLFLEALEGARIGLRIVHILRNPLEVAESLQRRDGLQRTDAVLQWLRHALDSEAATRSRNRVVLSYAALLKDWRAALMKVTEALQVDWPYSADEISGEVAPFLDGALRHHAHTTEDVLFDPAIRDWVGEAYAALLVLEQNPGSEAAERTLDAIRREFNHAAPVLHKLLAESRSQREKQFAQLKDAFTQSGNELDRLTATLAAREENVSGLAATLKERDKELIRMSAALEQTSREADQLATTLGEREQTVSKLESALRLAEAGAMRDSAAALADRDRRIADLSAELERHAQNATRLSAELSQVRTREQHARASQRQAEAECQAYRNSTSWRLTAPMRGMKQLLSEEGYFRLLVWQLVGATWAKIPLSSAVSELIDRTRGLFHRDPPSRGQRLDSSVRGGTDEPHCADGVRRFEVASKPIALYFSHNFQWQGAQLSLFEIAAGTQKLNRFQPLAMSKSNGPVEKCYSGSRIPTVLHSFPEATYQDPAAFEGAVIKLSAAIKKIGPSLIHVNTLQSFFSVLAAKKAGIPVLLNVRESEDPSTYYDRLPEPVRTQAYSTYRLADRIVFVSNETRKIWQDKFPDQSFELIYNGLDLARLFRRVGGLSRTEARRMLGVADEQILIVSVGTVSERKGQHDLINALHIIEAQLRKPVCLHLYGVSDTPYSAELKRMVKSCVTEWGASIKLVDESRSEAEAVDVAVALSAADIFVQCSRFESYPRSILEAMAFSVPVVSTRCFGALEMVQEGVSGLFYDAGDEGSLANRLTCLLRDAALRRTLSCGSGRRLKELHSYEGMIVDYDKLYQKYGAVHKRTGAP
jgi:glycosyltransferase involved in cell wall biosynthesis